MSTRQRNFQSYLTKCVKAGLDACFEHYVQTNHVFIKAQKSSNDKFVLDEWWTDFKRTAASMNIPVTKGKVSNAWKLLVDNCTNCSSKRSFSTMKSAELIERYVMTRHKADKFVFNGDNITEMFLNFANSSFEKIKSLDQNKCFIHDVNKWLAIHSILKINKALDSELSEFFAVDTLNALHKHFRLDVFGPPARLSSKERLSIISALNDFDEDMNTKKLRSSLAEISEASEGAVSRTVDALSSLALHMTKTKKPIGEKKIEGILESVWSSLFKVNNNYDPQHFDNKLFQKPHPLEMCRPDFAVEVDEPTTFINLVGEVKPFPSSAVGIAIDTYRLGIFSLALIEKYGLKSLMAFQAKGLDVTFYVTFFKEGLYFMVELERINFPSTYDEYSSFGALDKLLNVAQIFETHCVLQAQKQRTNVFSYESMKSIYGLNSNKSLKSDKQGATSSTDLPSSSTDLPSSSTDTPSSSS